jgi:hypothetical protein
MDAFVQLALIEKAKRVFAADPSIMLSFPLLSPLGFTDFSRAVNFLPRDIVASASDRMLWDVYHDVLTRAEVATSASTAVDNGVATAILYDVAADGRRIDSEALILFRQCRDAWIIATEDYAAHRLTGELSDDPVTRKQWSDIDEPQLRSAIDAALQDWETIGRRAEIEIALKTERAMAAIMPALRWQEWNAAFNPDLDMITEAGGGRYAPTGLSPRNFAEQNGWLSFDLSASEMTALVDGAPAPLKAVLDDDSGGGIERVTFEYRSVALVRPWFRPEALTSRIWRSADSDLQLSAGDDPPSGPCPAYTTACVFIRNLVVTPRGGGAAFRDLRFTIDPARLTRRTLKIEPALLARIVRQQADTPPPPSPPAPSVGRGVIRAFSALEQGSFKLAVSGHVKPMAERSAMIQRGALLNAGIRIPREVFGTLGTPPAPPSPPPPPVREEISILAFICKRLPKAPDPNPELQWE